ncbi:MAG: universal stress protein [Chloroflexi bacterium]|nr:universal stress protein [Chloroflexota bacterium]
MFHKILVPLDGSQLAESILPHVSTLALCGKAEVVLLRVHVRPVNTYGMLDAGDLPLTPEDEQADRRKALDYLKTVAQSLIAAGVPARPLVCDGTVAEAILQIADAEGADLIAMSTHGRSGIARWLIGSDANKVMHGARVPVLLIRPVHPLSSPVQADESEAVGI